MKKICLLFTFILLVLLLMGGNFKFNVNASNQFINKMNVIIYDSDYEVYNALGYEQLDIDYLTQEQVDELRTVDVDSSFSFNTYIKTEYFYENEIVVGSNDIIISEEEYLNEAISINDNSKINNMKTLRNVNEESYEQFEYKTIRLNGIYDGDYCNCEACTNNSSCPCVGCNGSCTSCSCNVGEHGRFIVSLTVNWLREPLYIGKDIIGLSFSNNLQFKKQQIGSVQHPIINFVTFYKRAYYHGDSGFLSEDEYIIGTNITNLEYDYNPNSGIVIPCDLQAIYTQALEQEPTRNDFTWILTEDLRFRLEAHFIPRVANINAAEFAGWYNHQYLTYSESIFHIFDTVSFSLTTTYPYIAFSTEAVRLIEAYFTTEGLNIYFENLYNDDEDDIGSC